MNRISLNILFFSFFVLLFNLNLSGQDTGKIDPNSEKVNDKTTADKVSGKNESSIKYPDKTGKIDIAPVGNLPGAVIEKKNQADISSKLLLLDEGNYKYTRIEGITFPRIDAKPGKDNIGQEEMTGNDDQKSSRLNSKEEADGFLGFSKEITDVIARVSLLLLIVLIFILYRLRSGASGMKVLRNYKKK